MEVVVFAEHIERRIKGQIEKIIEKGQKGRGEIKQRKILRKGKRL